MTLFSRWPQGVSLNCLLSHVSDDIVFKVTSGCLSQLSIVTCAWWHCFQSNLRASLSLNCLLSHVPDDIVFNLTSGHLSLNCLLSHVSDDIVFKVTSGCLSLNCLLSNVSDDIVFKVTSGCLSQLSIVTCVWWHCFQGNLRASLSQLSIATCVWWHCFQGNLRVSLSTVYCHMCLMTLFSRWPQGVPFNCLLSHVSDDIVFKVTSGCLSQLSIVTCVWWHCFQGDLRVSLSTVYCHMCLMTLFSRWPQGVSLNCLLSHVSDDIVFKVTSGRLSLNCLLPHVSGDIVFKVTSGCLSQLSIVTCVWWHCFQGDLRVSLSTVYCHMCLMTLFSRWPQGVSLNCLLSHVSDDIVFKVTSGCLSQLSIVTCVWWHCFQGNLRASLSQLSIATCVWWHCFQGNLRASLSTVYCHMCLMTLFSRWPQGVSLNCLLSHVSDDIVFKVTSGCLSQLSIVTCVWWHCFQGDLRVSLSTVYCHMCLMILFSRWPQGVSLNCLLSHVSDDIVFRVTSGHISLSQLSIVTCVWWHYFQGNPIVSYLSRLSIVASMCLSVKKQLQWNLDISRFIFSWVFTIHPL